MSFAELSDAFCAEKFIVCWIRRIRLQFLPRAPISFKLVYPRMDADHRLIDAIDAMMAFFNTTDDRSMKAPSSNEIDQYNLDKIKWDKTKATLESHLESYLKNESLKKQAEWEKTYRPTAPKWSVFAIEKLAATGNVQLTLEDNKVIKASGNNPETATYTIVGRTDLKRLTGVKLTSIKVNDKGAGRADNGNFVINEVQTKLLLPDGSSQLIKFTKAVATFSQK